jgi:hypothetical protein
MRPRPTAKLIVTAEWLCLPLAVFSVFAAVVAIIRTGLEITVGAGLRLILVEIAEPEALFAAFLAIGLAAVSGNAYLKVRKADRAVSISALCG